MTILLKDVDDAIAVYISNHVNVTINNIKPLNGSQINPNEKFSFDVVVKNNVAIGSGVLITDISFDFDWSGNNRGNFVIPSSSLGQARKRNTSWWWGDWPVAAPGSLYDARYRLFLSDPNRRSLVSGQTQTISGLQIQTPSSPGTIYFRAIMNFTLGGIIDRSHAPNNYTSVNVVALP